MAIFVEVITDAFEENLNSQVFGGVAGGRRARAGKLIARRPTRGLEIKEDTHASIKVILSDGSELPLVDSSSRDGVSTSGYSNFILQRVSETRMEKHQIVETFGASYIFFFGENPRFLDVSAVIINSHDFNWEAEWWENYNENFRGTKLVEKGGRLYLFYDDNIVEGYMLMCQADKVSDQPHLIQMSFRLFLTNYRNISRIGDPNFPVHDEAIITDTSNDPRNIFGPPGSTPGGQFGATPQLSQTLQQAAETTSLPVRSLIADNFDEYVGAPQHQSAFGIQPSNSGGLPTLSPPAQRKLEVDDLHQETVGQLGARGAEVDNPQTLSDLGLMPNFESDARSPATFRPKEKEVFSFDTNGETTSNDPVDPLTLRADPLGAVFGSSVSIGASESFDRRGDNRFTEGTGDAEYGFKSSFSSGPGFGVVGFGDFGGPGFGSGQGASGDPGFKSPSKFGFSGVVRNKAAFTNFRRPRPDQSAFGAGAGIGSSSSGNPGGASVHVGGKASPFALVSVGGTLKLL